MAVLAALDWQIDNVTPAHLLAQLALLTPPAVWTSLLPDIRTTLEIYYAAASWEYRPSAVIKAVLSVVAVFFPRPSTPPLSPPSADTDPLSGAATPLSDASERRGRVAAATCCLFSGSSEHVAEDAEGGEADPYWRQWIPEELAPDVEAIARICRGEREVAEVERLLTSGVADPLPAAGHAGGDVSEEGVEPPHDGAHHPSSSLEEASSPSRGAPVEPFVETAGAYLSSQLEAVEAKEPSGRMHTHADQGPASGKRASGEQMLALARARDAECAECAGDLCRAMRRIMAQSDEWCLESQQSEEWGEARAQVPGV